MKIPSHYTKVRDVKITPDELIAFEDRVKEAYEAGQIKGPIHLSKNNEEQLIELLNGLTNKHKIYWCANKDDMPPQELFKKFKEGAKERAEIGKYCIQDCALCNKLIEKLKIIVNNIGMANVCSVPLSYLFLKESLSDLRFITYCNLSKV